ncbi:hypothetical protein K3495_g7524 [Podosphaera aphanis]|nr:hypothetical protein K3495_g7524 [Podosphaera aphanis]
MSQNTAPANDHFYINELEKEYLVSTIKDWSLSHGLVVKPSASFPPGELHDDVALTAPVTLFPSPFPRICFDQARCAQKDFNLLYAYISQDEEFLQTILAEILDVDDFISELWNIHVKVKHDGYAQNLSLGMYRSDYMVHQETIESRPTIKQVEFNTIASSFGGLSSLTSKLHRFLVKEKYHQLQNIGPIDDLALPENQCTYKLAQGLQIACKEYIKRNSPSERDFCVIFLVHASEQNIFDQRHLEFSLNTLEPRTPVFRLPFGEILKHTKLGDTPKRELLYILPNNPSKLFEVAVVYFRAGYGPSDYPDRTAWAARLQIEKSNAIKCPSILTQLAGAKKVQQVLANPKFIANKTALDLQDVCDFSKLKEMFTDIYALDDSPSGLRAQKIATDCDLCKDYVLKPQREGGGNNVYRSEIPKFLTSLPKTKWKSYILMKIITPPPVYNLRLKNGVVSGGGVICELGIFGTCLWDHGAKEILYSEDAGYLLRTKSNESEEGGVATGYSSLDSCRLI